ncbi:ferredoxin [Nocardioides carbamazepini]|uniref:ferredoxin n=1 Tax=Nocardioides carbamazepini TaxID=2854259 RepID=UPI002149DC7A|nr:ferredoxin [Nocardioides carbamazepini]MCR1784516.1 ferredoxin [Nocardioides carbamazepini]
MTESPTVQITIDITECCASGMCAAIAPQAFEVDTAGYAVVRPDAGRADLDDVVRAARNCPTLCIAVARSGAEIDLFA